MKDGIMADISKTREKLAKRIEGMAADELAAFVSKSMIGAEMGIAAAAERLCEASKDRLDGFAMDTLVLKRAEYAVQGAHSDLSAVNAQILGVPVPRAGDR